MTAGPRSSELYARACELMPAGVNSPVRAFGSVGGEPIFYAEAPAAASPTPMAGASSTMSDPGVR